MAAELSRLKCFIITIRPNLVREVRQFVFLIRHPRQDQCSSLSGTMIARARIWRRSWSIFEDGDHVLGSESPLQISQAGAADRPKLFIERAFGNTDNLSWPQ